jgi:hypothetical protein
MNRRRTLTNGAYLWKYVQNVYVNGRIQFSNFVDSFLGWQNSEGHFKGGSVKGHSLPQGASNIFIFLGWSRRGWMIYGDDLLEWQVHPQQLKNDFLPTVHELVQLRICQLDGLSPSGTKRQYAKWTRINIFF